MMIDCNGRHFAPETIRRVSELAEQFEEDFRSSTGDSANFKSMDELEAMLTKLVGDTRDEYRGFFEKLVTIQGSYFTLTGTQHNPLHGYRFYVFIIVHRPTKM